MRVPLHLWWWLVWPDRLTSAHVWRPPIGEWRSDDRARVWRVPISLQKCKSHLTKITSVRGLQIASLSCCYFI